MAGFHGHYLRYDLTRGRGERVAIPAAVLRAYVGGVGLGTWILQREAPPGVDPLAPEAPLVFAFSPLVGTALTTSAKFAVLAKSPLTGLLSDALSSSHFAIEGKRTGVDAIVLHGRCAVPSVLLNDTLVATDLWGETAERTAEALAAHGRVAAIGRAGECGVRFATISNDGRHAGRGGLGAVMGAKRLKAIALRGRHDTPLADPPRVRALARALAERSLGEETAKYRELGTASNLLAFERVGALPGPNFGPPRARDVRALDPASLGASQGHRRSSCASCTIGCEHRYGAAGGTRGEYESLFALGPLCGIHEPAAVLAAVARCDTHGLDTLSAGGTVAFAMECRERGLLPGAPRFGDAEGLLGTLDAIATRSGLGDLLAEGSRRAAWRIGGDSLDFAPQVKGMEIPGYEPRALQTLALGLAVGTRGADHNRSSAYELDFSDEVDRLHGNAHAARRAIEPEDRAALLDSLVLCKFLRGAFDDLYGESAALLEAVTGLAFSGPELRRLATRVVDLKKRFNVREGWKPADDTLPARLLREPVGSGPVASAHLPAERLAAMVRSYNLARGWSAEGFPPEPPPQELLLDA